MPDHNPNDYGPLFADLLSEDTELPLGPGQPDAAARPVLQSMTLDNAFAGHTIADRRMAECCLSGVWLYHGFLDRSHEISQSVKTPTGSYWHGIMHRREPDYPNAKFWFGNAGQHPVFDPLARAAAEEAADVQDDRAAELRNGGPWDPRLFVDLCEAGAAEGESGELASFCRRVQTREWWLLFDYCYHSAIGR